MDDKPLIIITGGAGFIGSHLVERLLNEDFSIAVIDDLSTGRIENLKNVIDNPNLKFIRGKISEISDLCEIASKATFIFHLAAAVGVELVLKKPVSSIENNIIETMAVLNAAKESRVPILIASTSEVYGKSKAKEFSEDDDLLIGPPHLIRWSYACSKLMDEFIALSHAFEHGLPVTIARIFNTVGPRQTGRYGMVFPRFISRALKNEPLFVYGTGRQTRCFCNVLDTVSALTGLMKSEKTRNEIYNVGSDREISILDLAKLVVKTLNSKSEIRLIPYEQAYPPGFEDMQRRKPDISKIRSAIGYNPRYSLEETIIQTAKVIEENHGEFQI